MIRIFALALFCGFAVPAAPAGAQQNVPLPVAQASYIFAGGHYVTADGEQYMTGQVYAEYWIPRQRTHRYPIVMIEGGWQTGANFTGTPDGREGWMQYFVRRGYAVYVVDQPGRGRSAYHAQTYGPLGAQPPLDFILKYFAAPERYNLWPQAGFHTQFPGKATPGNPAFDQFVSEQVPDIANFTLQQVLNRDAAAALLDKIGPAIVLTHSQSGAFGWPIADARPALVKAIVAIEPSGPPVHNVTFLGAPDYFSDDPHLKISGLGDVPLTYSPSVTEQSPLEFVRQTTPDRTDLVHCWSQRAPARHLVNLTRIPIAIITSEASYHASYDHCTSRYLKQAGVEHTWIRLADVGIRGNGHMMMIEKNNREIAGVIIRWLESRHL